MFVKNEEQIQHSTGITTVKTGDEDINEVKLQVGDINEENAGVESDKQIQQNTYIATEETGKGNSHSERTDLDGSAQSGIASEVHASSKSGSNIRKVQKWENIQPILGTIDEMMSFRIQKPKDMVNNSETTNGIHLPTVAKVESAKKMSNHDGEGVVDKEEASDKKRTYDGDGEGTADAEGMADAEEALDKKKLSNDNEERLVDIEEASAMKKMSIDDGEGTVDMEEASDKRSESSTQEEAEIKGVPAERHIPWREELESLVRGGIPKDLRGDVILPR